MRRRWSNRSGHLLIAGIMLVFGGLVARLIYITVHRGPGLLLRAERQQRSTVPIQARRGFIVDTQGRILAGTMLRRSVFADPFVLPDKTHAAAALAEVLGADPVEIGQDFISAGNRRFLVVRRGVSEEQAERIRSAGIYGLGVFDEPYRTYPSNGLAAPVVGFVAPDGQGVSGLEHQYDGWLAGENGIKTIIRDAGRRAFWLAEGGYRPARDGLHLVLTLDAEIQANAEREVAAAVSQYRAESGMAIVMDPRTGDILAMVNVPGFDPNHYGDFSVDRYRNRCITDPFEPGSTFKVFVAAAALADGLVRLDEPFDCERGLWQDGPRLLHDHHPYGVLSFQDVIIKSSNIGMGKLGKRLGNDRLYEIVTRFGFGSPTGSDLHGESGGLLRPLRRWDTYSTTSLPMGQEISVTALQLASAFCVLANGGLRIQPRMVRAVLGADGQVLREFTPPQDPQRILPGHAANLVKQELLAETVRRGTGSRAALPNYQVFGKTGTAQIARKAGKGFEKDAYLGSFVGGAPASDPRLVVMVAVRRPQRSLGYYGGTVAAPTAGRILRHGLAYLRVPEERMDALKLPQATGAPTD